MERSTIQTQETMTNIAYQDVAGGVIHIYTANKHLPKWERLRKARKELESVACINVFIVKGNKVVKLSTVMWEHDCQWYKQKNN